MRESEKNVGRADHNPSQRNDEQGEHSTVGDSADQRAHGAHGRGTRGQEQKLDPTSPAPDSAKGTDRGGSAGWGSEGSGGSTIDKTSPER
ncbi:MAG: hypothetical protein HOQ11_03455 [Gemmatimonadaceae bacterium]|nr:hypothetical protein [Gemmatimonadaceae bacterium]NUQ93355.1 hypothetical protein [Gemmatimonadaceae bacterium]NUR19116.1 hypothetical protein [Gemmatimonadaceae bacterium]NUS96447.1 hypothetical protein [Gemmatimonadaceae bacterium]